MKAWIRTWVVVAVGLMSLGALAEPTTDRLKQEYLGQGADPGATRLSVTYVLNAPLSGETEVLRFDTGHHVGLELASGDFVRYHLEALYGNVSGIDFLKLEPLSWGIPIRLARRGKTLIDLEPVISFANFEVGFLPGGDVLVTLSSAVRFQINIALGAFYLGLVPAGFEVRYVGVETIGEVEGNTAFAIDFRPQVLVGVNF